MPIDTLGYITQPKCAALQPEFSIIVERVVERLIQCFHEQIHSLYVYGSVAQGRAKSGESDLDLTIIFNQQLDRTMMRQLTDMQVEMAKHLLISKIDFDCGTLKQVLNPENRLSWGYWLKHHCVCVYGEDLGLRFNKFKPSKAIAVAVNDNFLARVKNIITQMRGSDNLNIRQQLQRAAARKTIRATNILREVSDSDWPDTLMEYRIKFNQRYPALAEEMDFLLAVGQRPHGDIDNFTQRVLAFAGWLDAEFERQTVSLPAVGEKDE